MKSRTVPLTLNPCSFVRGWCARVSSLLSHGHGQCAVSQGPWRLAVLSSVLCSLTGFLLTGDSWTMISSNVFAGKNRGHLSIYSIQLPKVAVEIFVGNHDNLDLCKTRASIWGKGNLCKVVLYWLMNWEIKAEEEPFVKMVWDNISKCSRWCLGERFFTKEGLILGKHTWSPNISLSMKIIYDIRKTGREKIARALTD